jgi:hypothetical protein
MGATLRLTAGRCGGRDIVQADFKAPELQKKLSWGKVLEPSTRKKKENGADRPRACCWNTAVSCVRKYKVQHMAGATRPVEQN